ncbi:isopeptide-forming domain-containing fimbrial protein [Specibacter sp. RAF43]|uniref:isopeptide-forming domain-containing fimbrial protein n=1 Tax=Specibacter sp. RAF43 TaxID=3233057 RepID=UPI003F9C489E
MHRFLALLTTLALLAMGLLIPAPSAGAATPGITVHKSAPGSVLVGDAISYTLTASNPAGAGATAEYNVSFRDVLPAGVSYVAGSTGPASAGEPSVYPNQPAVGQTTLVWRDVFDLQIGDTNSLTFMATPDAAAHPVGDNIANTGQGFANTDPRTVPTFDAAGKPTTGFTQQAISNTTATGISALAIKKTEPSPEAELLRGLHDHPTVYTIPFTNNSKHPTNNVVVTNYVPANLEFLGCGLVDNTTSAGTNPGGKEEFPGSGLLTTTPAVPDPASTLTPAPVCPVPASVSTVQNPAGYASGVYTKVVWSLGTLPAHQTINIQYAAAVPLRENVMFTSPPAPADGLQTANLDNNTGPLTRQDGGGKDARNHVEAAGTYTGPVTGGATSEVVARNDYTVTVHDLRLLKSSSTGQFVAGAQAAFTLTLESGEYTDNSAITITDTIPNGICPLGPTNYTTGAPADCAPVSGQTPSTPYRSVTQNPDGTFTVVFEAVPQVDANGVSTITYPVRLRNTYTGGALAGTPTAAGDSFTNTAVQTGTSAAVGSNTVDSGTKPITDPTAVTLGSKAESLTTEVAKRATPMDCSTQGNYVVSTTPLQPELTFVAGDKVCFRLTVAFSDQTDTKNPTLSDFLPGNLDYDAGSAAAGPANNIAGPDLGPSNSMEPGTANGVLDWNLGALQNDGSRAVPANATFQVVFSATVRGAAAGPTPDKADNLAKLRVTNSAGTARSLRANAGVQVDPAAANISKGVASVNGTAHPGGGDHVAVKEGAQVLFHVAVKNTSGTNNTVPQSLSNLDVWDVLPLPLTCADVSGPTDGGKCTDPGDANQPTFTGRDKRSAIRWSGAVTLAPGETHTYGYTATVPAGTGIGEQLNNTSAVRSYVASTNKDDAGTTSYPGSNIDTTVDPALQGPNPVTDASDIYLPSPIVAKGVTSEIGEAGNTGAESGPGPSTQLVPGESVTFTVTAKLPAGATVFKGTFADPMPSGLIQDSATADFALDGSGASPSYGPLPSGMSFSAGPVATVALGDVYDNTTTTPQIIRIIIKAHADKAKGAVLHGAKLTNTATLSSAGDPRTGFKPSNASAPAAGNIAEPAPALAKSNNNPAASKTVAAGTTVTYTLTASNAPARPVLHDAWVVDCIPAGLSFAGYGTASQGTTLAAGPGAGPGGDNRSCPTGTTQLSWNVGDLAGGQTETLTYTATVDTTATGSVVYTNVAAIAGNSLAGPRTAPADPGNALGRDYTKTANSAVKVAGATSTKTVDPGEATIGQSVTYTVSTKLPANVNFFNASIVDTVPAGLDVASVQLLPGSVTCTNNDTTPCGLTSATQLPASGSTLVFALGDAPSLSQVRTVSLQYTAKVADVGAAVAGATLSNAAHPAWDVTSKPAPGSSGYTFDQAGANAAAPLKIVEPKVGIAKAVNGAKRQPGETFTYTVTATNAPTASAAYSVVVQDVVPANIVVDAATITGGGTLTGNDPVTGGGKITWTVAGPVAPGGVVGAAGFTYSAKLGPSGGLSAAPLTSTATVTGYESLPTGGRKYTGPSAAAAVTPLFPKLTATKTTPAGSIAYIGETLAWKVAVTNDPQAGTALNAGASDVLPASWTYTAGSAQVSVNGGPATGVEPTVNTANGVQTLQWNALGTLPAGAALTINYSATPGNNVPTTPGVGMHVDHTNTATPAGEDATGATGNQAGSYSGPQVSATAHIAAADVAIAKKVGVAPVAGSGGSWILTATSNGPDTATGPFTVTDPSPLPAGITITGAGGAGWSCTTSPVSCTRTNAADTLANGAAFPDITLNYSVSAGVPDQTAYENTATVSTHSYDPNTGNNTATASITVVARADLGLQKTLTSPLVAGRDASYAIDVTNYGPSVSKSGFSVEDVLPAGTTFVSAAGTNWSCTDPAGGAAKCTYAQDLAPGSAAAQLQVTVTIPPSQTEPVVNEATVTPITAEPADATHPNTDTVSTEPTQLADLGISKALDGPLVAGSTASYTIQVANHGPSNARSVKVVDTLNPDLSYDSFTGADWSCAATGQSVTCDYVAAGAFPATSPATVSTLVLTVKVAQALAAPVGNTATVTTSTPDNGPTPNTSTAPGTVTGVADLSLTKTHPGSVNAGASLTYKLAVHNAGPSNSAAPTTVTDLLPLGMTFTGAAGGGWSCAADGRHVTCTNPAIIPAGADATALNITALVAADAGPTTLTNSANVTGGPGVSDPNIGDNAASDPTQVTEQSAMDLGKTLVTAAPVAAGTNATFTLQATNNGPSDARNVVVSDTLPQYLSYVSADGDGWSCTAAMVVVTCQRPYLSAASGGAAPPITLVAKVDPGTPLSAPTGMATLTNSSTITTSSPSTLPARPATADVPVVGSADLAITKSGEAPTVIAGAGFTWTLNVKNNGPSDAAKPVTVTDTLPSHQTFTSFKGDGWECSPGPVPADPATGQQTVTCTYAGLLTGASASPLHITGQVDSTATEATASNAASVTSPTPDPDADNNTTTASVDVNRVLDLNITKTHTGTGVVGSTVAFQLAVRNDSPTTATKVQVEDPMPGGLTLDSAAGDGWVCATGANKAVCDLTDPLAPNASAPVIAVTAKVLAAAYPSVTNVAAVSSLDPELPGSHESSDKLLVDPSAQLSIVKSHTGDFQAGSHATYSLALGNLGPTASPGPVTVTNVLPAGLTYVMAEGTDWDCKAIGQNVKCVRDGALAIGAAAPITLRVKVLSAAFPSVETTAKAEGPGSSPAMSTDTATVNPLVVWSLNKTLDDYSENTARYVLTAKNDGPHPTSAPITITDVLPAGLEFISAIGDGSQCTNSAGTVTCLHTSSVASGAWIQATITAKVTAAPGTTVSNIASVTGGSPASGHTPEVGSTPTTTSPAATFTATEDGALANTGARTLTILLWAGSGILGLGLALLLIGRARRRA